MQHIEILGAGITGLWQAVMLSKAGHRVRLVEKSADPFADAASRLAGAMLAPFCEAEAAGPAITGHGLSAIDLWNRHYPNTCNRGSLVVATARDTPELSRFARAAPGFEWLDAAQIATLEPGLEDRFAKALLYPGEAHIDPRRALSGLLDSAIAAGCTAIFGDLQGRNLQYGAPGDPAGECDAAAGWVIDCRGMAAADELPGLRGVRGEMLVIETAEIALQRPIRLLHPRIPFYIVPWAANRFMLGATVIESSEGGAVSVRSALELLGAAYTLHPAFGEAKIVEFGAGVRPAFAGNLPKIVVRGRRIYVNGLFRHGFLLAPVLARQVQRFIENGETSAFIESGDEVA